MRLVQLITICCGLIAAMPTPVLAQDSGGGAAKYASTPSTELIETLQRNRGALREDQCTVNWPIFAELMGRYPTEERFQKSELMIGSICAFERKDFAEADARFTEFERRFGSTGMDRYGLQLSVVLDDGQTALFRLRTIIRRYDEAAAGAPGTLFPKEIFWPAIRLIRQSGLSAELRAIGLELYRSPAFAALEPETQSGVAAMALSAMLEMKPAEQIQSEEVTSALTCIRDPAKLIELLSAREFTGAWPQIEAKVGDNLLTATGAYRQWTATRLQEAGDDRDRFSDAVHAQYYDGRFEEALALARQWRAQAGVIDQIEEGDAWAANIEAYALDALGRTGEADEVFDELALLNPQENGWVVNFVINRASRLVGQLRWEEGLAAATLAGSVAENHGSAYAKMLVAQAEVCALVGLSRTQESETQLTYLTENWRVGPGIAVQGLQCAEREDEATGMLVKALQDEGTRIAILPDLQNAAFELFYTPSLLAAPRDLLAQSAEAQALFEQYARVIPERFTPRAAQLRAEPKRP